MSVIDESKEWCTAKWGEVCEGVSRIYFDDPNSLPAQKRTQSLNLYWTPLRTFLKHFAHTRMDHVFDAFWVASPKTN
ncbi:unnamed protein product [Camellia sinensis]